MKPFQDSTNELFIDAAIFDGGQRSRSRAAFRTDELFVLYWAGEMLSTHSRRDFRLWSQGRSSWICSFRAALTMEADGIAIALWRYLIHSFRQLKVRGYFPVSPQAAQFADLLFIPRRYFRWRSWTCSKGCLAMAVMSILPSCLNLFTNFFMIGNVGSQIWHPYVRIGSTKLSKSLLIHLALMNRRSIVFRDWNKHQVVSYIGNPQLNWIFNCYL